MNCLICESESSFKFTSELGIPVYQCGDIRCSHLFVEQSSDTGIYDRGEDLSIEKLKQDRAYRVGRYDRRNRSIFLNIWKKLELKENANVLDFGSGDGNFIYSLKNIFPNVKVTCIEPHYIFSTLLAEVADNIVDSTNELTEKFDLIILNEVIEHLNDPVAVLKALAPLLKKNNSGFFIATPLGETHLGSNSTGAYNTNSHLHFFTRKSLNTCLIKSGLTPLDVYDINYPIYSTLLEKSIIQKIKHSIKKLIINKILKLHNRYCVLPSAHISGLCYKAE